MRINDLVAVDFDRRDVMMVEAEKLREVVCEELSKYELVQNHLVISNDLVADSIALKLLILLERGSNE